MQISRLYTREGHDAFDGIQFTPRTSKIVNPNGSVVKVRLLAEEFGIAVNVDLSPSRYGELELRIGEQVYVFPQRFRVFVPDYSI